MAVKTTWIFFLLLVISVGFLLFIRSWGNLSHHIRFLGNQKSRDGDSWSDHNITFLDNKGHSSRPPAEIFTTQNTLTKFKTDRMRSSTRGTIAETPMPILYKSAFKKLPHWDFDDKYNQDGPYRQTTCAQSLRKSEDASFKKAFLPNIRLYLHKDNINMSEWNRLSHFNNPFGFMGFKYDEAMSSMKLIPKPKEPLLLPDSGGCVRCAVVGTSGILNGSKMGKEIDAHDYVFRMNGAVIKGYEEDVGHRTSVYVHTAHSIATSLYLLKKYGYTSVPNDEGIKYVLIPEGMRDLQWLQGLIKGERVSAGPYHNTRPRTYYAQQYNESRFYVLHQDFLRYVRNRFLLSPNLNSSYWAIVRPTNGAFTIFLALHTCDIVDAYGFMTEDHKKYSNYYYERNVKTHVIFYANHDYMLEKKVWKKMHDSKLIKLYQRMDPETEKPKQ